MELLGHCLKEHRDIETGQARCGEQGGVSVCLCAGVGQAFVFVTGAAFGR